MKLKIVLMILVGSIQMQNSLGQDPIRKFEIELMKAIESVVKIQENLCV